MFDPRHKPVLLLDEDELRLGAAVDALSEIGYPVTAARSAEDALVLAGERSFEVFLVSLSLRTPSVEEVLGDLRRARPQVPLVLMADPDEVADAVGFFRAGIEDYLIRPLQTLEVRARLGRILERHDLDTHVSFLTSEIARRAGSHPTVARSREMGIVLGRIERIAPMRSTVLILGESGVGKELVARSIHFHSPRKNQPFVAL